MKKTKLINHLLLIIIAIVISLFLYDLQFGVSKIDLIKIRLLIWITIGSVIWLYLIWWIYCKIVSLILKKDFYKFLEKDIITYMPFLLLGFFPLRYFVGSLEQKFMQFSNLPSAIIFIFAFSLFILLKVYFLEINIKNRSYFRKILLVIIFIFFITFSMLGILKHHSFFSTGADLGIYNQAMYGYSKGKILDSIMGFPLLGDHIEWITFLILPAYILYPSPEILIMIQLLFICAGAFILYAISKDILKNEFVSLIISITYLIYPAVQYSALFDFHPLVLSLPFIFLSIYSLIKEKYGLLVLSLFLVGTSKEYLTLMLMPFGIFLMFIKFEKDSFIKFEKSSLLSKKRIIGFLIALAGLSWFVLNINVLTPLFLGHKYLYINQYFGSNTVEIIKTFLFNPLHVIKYLFTINKLAFLILFSMPLFFGIFALIAPEFLFLGITEFFVVVMHQEETLSQVVYHHQVTLVPFILVATVIGINRLSKFIKNRNIIIAGSFCILSAAILSNLFISPFAILYDLDNFNIKKPYVREGKELLSMIPEDASVIAQNWVVPHLSTREEVYDLIDFIYLPNGSSVKKAIPPNREFIVIDLSNALNDPKRGIKYSKSDALTILFNKKEYGIIAVKGDWVLLKNNASYEKGICKLRPFLDKSRYSYLDIKIYDEYECIN